MRQSRSEPSVTASGYRTSFISEVLQTCRGASQREGAGCTHSGHRTTGDRRVRAWGECKQTNCARRALRSRNPWDQFSGRLDDARFRRFGMIAAGAHSGVSDQQRSPSAPSGKLSRKSVLDLVESDELSAGAKKRIEMRELRRSGVYRFIDDPSSGYGAFLFSIAVFAMVLASVVTLCLQVRRPCETRMLIHG